MQDFDAAEALYQEALSIRESVCGIEAPDTIATLHNLAELCDAASRHDEYAAHDNAWYHNPPAQDLLSGVIHDVG